MEGDQDGPRRTSQKHLAFFLNCHPSIFHTSLLDVFWNLIECVVCLGNDALITTAIPCPRPREFNSINQRFCLDRGHF